MRLDDAVDEGRGVRGRELGSRPRDGGVQTERGDEQGSADSAQDSLTPRQAAGR
jgi:hypothetical protein